MILNKYKMYSPWNVHYWIKMFKTLSCRMNFLNFQLRDKERNHPSSCMCVCISMCVYICVWWSGHACVLLPSEIFLATLLARFALVLMSSISQKNMPVWNLCDPLRDVPLSIRAWRGAVWCCNIWKCSHVGPSSFI